jgi:hypothetical protein
MTIENHDLDDRMIHVMPAWLPIAIAIGSAVMLAVGVLADALL